MHDQLESFNLILFGITSNLSQIKIIPALYSFEEKGLFSESTQIIGIARKDWDRNQFENFIKESLINHKSIKYEDKTLSSLLKKMKYIQGNFNLNDSDAIYPQLTQFKGNNLFYLATYPNLYEQIFIGLKKYKLNLQDNGWSRVMIEKPIGTNWSSSMDLNKKIQDSFYESQIYRLDHYLGKETLQNILAFRFGNVFIQSLMSNQFVEQIQITAAESFGIGARGGYYDSMGALLDVGQNHLLQMLVVATMEAPESFTNDDVTKERIQILENLRPIPNSLVLGQYNGYLYEENIDPNSKTDTFFAFKTEIDNERWRGVPIFIRAGKKLKTDVTEISIVFKQSQNQIFNNFELESKPNILTFRIQPNEGIGMDMLFKKPGHKFQLTRDYMQFCYRNDQKPLDAYEKLLFDAIKGDATFFNDSPEVSAAWKFIDKLKAKNYSIQIYEPGSWGPELSNEMINNHGFSWIEPTENLCTI